MPSGSGLSMTRPRIVCSVNAISRPKSTISQFRYSQNRKSGMRPMAPYSFRYGRARLTYRPNAHLDDDQSTAAISAPTSDGRQRTWVFGMSL